jgi:hypothetical protein
MFYGSTEDGPSMSSYLRLRFHLFPQKARAMAASWKTGSHDRRR